MEKQKVNERLNDACNRILELIENRPSDKEAIREKLNKLDKLLRYKPSFYTSEKRSKDDMVGHSQTEIERRRVDKRLQGFVVKESRAWKAICSHYGSSLNQVELLSLAEVLGHILSIKVDREAKRRKEVLIKWFDENIDKIEPMLDRVIPEDQNGNEIFIEK